MAVAGWILDKSAASRAADPGIRRELAQLAGLLFVCPIGELEQLYSARSAEEYASGHVTGAVHLAPGEGWARLAYVNQVA